MTFQKTKMVEQTSKTLDITELILNRDNHKLNKQI